LTNFINHIRGYFYQKTEWLLPSIYALIVVLSILVGVASELYFLAVIPVVLLLVYVSIIDFKNVFFLLLMLLPLSMEVDLPGGFSTDFPAELLMVGLTLVYFLYVLQNGKTMSAAFLRHPLTLLFLLHIGWTFVTMITSNAFGISLKFMLAKIWYVTTFYFLAGTVFQNIKDFKAYLWTIFVPLIFSIIIINIKHYSFDFQFEKINYVVHPFYRNHVDYACLMALFFPVIVLTINWYKDSFVLKWILRIGAILVLIGIYFSYTRAAYVAIVLAFGAYFIMRFRLMKISLVTALAVFAMMIGYLSYNNNYLEMAPDYNKTITHNDFNNLIEATYKGEDISTMERVYRWVAGFQMIKAEPLTGFGPGTFVSFYESYTLSNFQTYVSDNPERSGIHSYYFMIMVEQGLPGLAIFLLLIGFILIKGEEVYQETKDPKERVIVLIAVVSIIVIDALLLINDMLESDKVGPFFFISMALIVNQDLKNKRASQPVFRAQPRSISTKN